MHNLQKPIVGTLVQGWTNNPCLAARLLWSHACLRFQLTSATILKSQLYILHLFIQNSPCSDYVTHTLHVKSCHLDFWKTHGYFTNDNFNHIMKWNNVGHVCLVSSNHTLLSLLLHRFLGIKLCRPT